MCKTLKTTKKLIIILVITIIIPIAGAQEYYQLEENYGVKVNNFYTGSGFKMETEVSVFIESNKRSLEAGIFYDYDSKNISGINIEHDIILSKSRYHNKRSFSDYFFYNFILRKTKLHASDFTLPEVGANYDNTSVFSMEHHVGLGCKLKLTGSLYAYSSIGYGLYLGSIKKITQPTADLPFVKGRNGWGEIFKLGFGFDI